LTYSTSDLSLVTGTYHSVGSGSAAGKAADCNLISAGDVRCILSGINTTTIGSGAVASLTFQIAGGTTDTSTQVSMANVVAADVNANSLGVTDSGAIVTINQPLDCTYSLSANSSSIGSSAGSSSFNVVAPTGCAWSVTNDSTFITITGGSSGSGNGTVAYSFTANSGAGRSGTLMIATQTFTLDQAGLTSSGLAFYPMTPCRIADTRASSGFSGAFGAPSLAAAATRSFPIQSSACSVPGTAQAYSLNIAVIPAGPLAYLTAWPAGSAMPVAATLNASTGSTTANAALVQAGTGGAIDLYASSVTDVVIDINGYFAPPGSAGALAFYPVTPCRVADTRSTSGFSGAFGPPSLVSGATRNFPVQQSSCGIPATVQAYSMRMTVVPPGPMGYLTTWPAGLSMPVAATLNAPEGGVVGNAAIIPAGSATGEPVSVYVNDPTDLVIDINGYFAAPGYAGALYFYPLAPCRVVDTRGNGFTGAFGAPSLVGGATRSFPIPTSSCDIPGTAQAYSFNVTAIVPSDGSSEYFTAYPAGLSEPIAATVNAPSGGVVGSAAIVPAGTSGAVSVFANHTANMVLDNNGYFAP
jgi:hypothetical protein